MGRACTLTPHDQTFPGPGNHLGPTASQGPLPGQVWWEETSTQQTPKCWKMPKPVGSRGALAGTHKRFRRSVSPDGQGDVRAQGPRDENTQLHPPPSLPTGPTGAVPRAAPELSASSSEAHAKTEIPSRAWLPAMPGKQAHFLQRR